MDYSALIAQVPPISGKFLSIILFGIALLIVLIIVSKKILSKLRENETLKREFITIVAHKFRTPLTQTRWLTEGLLSEEQDSYKKESLTQIQKANQGLIDLTGTLIELADSDNSSKTGYKFERTELAPLVRSVSESLRNLFKEKNIFFSVECPPPPIFAKIDTSRMEFALQTILTNAQTYTPPGRNVSISLIENAGHAVISVTDHGIGIDSKDLPHIFSKFYRTENAQQTDTEGFGVGLFLVSAIIRRHKGRLDVYSEGIGKGSTFTIVIPAVK